MEKIKSYIAQNRERFLEDLFGVLRIPSISSQSVHADDMKRCAGHLCEELLRSGADYADVMPTGGYPVVYGEKMVNPEAPTILVYGHYDVMPPDPLDQWLTDPFEPVIRDGRIWGRGTDDDKGQTFIQIKAFETMVRTGTLPCNVKFLLEGEEEMGSVHLGDWCIKHADMLQADVIIVSDTAMLSETDPSITCGLRGICYMQVDVTGPNQDLHSGIYGGTVANPVQILCHMIDSLLDASNRITIPHFYDGIVEPSPEEREIFAKTPFDEELYKKEIQVEELAGEEGYTPLERTGIRPSLDVNGIWSGYTGEGAKTIIPSTAHAKISMRLVPGQDYHRIAESFSNYMQSIAPRTVRVKSTLLHRSAPYMCPTNLPAYQAATRAIEETFGKSPLPFYSGGSIGVISEFDLKLGLKSLLLGFGGGEDAIHSPNESFSVQSFFQGIETVVRFYHHFAAMPR